MTKSMIEEAYRLGQISRVEYVELCWQLDNECNMEHWL